jgi:hypothetical protein
MPDNLECVSSRDIVISYSKFHFDPRSKSILDGTGELAAELWRCVNKLFPNDRLHYFDYSDFNSVPLGLDVKLFIGVSPNFHSFVQILKPAKAILWSVNASAFSRRSIVASAKTRGLPKGALSSQDGILSNLQESSLADLVIVLGGWENYQSYREIGKGPNEVFAIGSGYRGLEEMRSFSGGGDILFFTGGLSFRKGAHFIKLVLDVLNKHEKTKLKVVGRTSSDYWSHEIESLIRLHPNRLEYIPEWINFNSIAWEQVVSSCKFAVFPSFEEGVAAAVADVISSGVPVVYSIHSGYENTKSLAFMDLKSDSLWMDYIEELLEAEPAFLKQLLSEQQQLIRNGSLQESNQIERSLNRLVQGEIWPSIHLKRIECENSFTTDLPTSDEFSEYTVTIARSPADLLYHFVLEVSGEKCKSYSDLTRMGIMVLDRYFQLPGILIKSSDNNFLEILISRNISESDIPKDELDSDFKYLKIFDSSKHMSLTYKWRLKIYDSVIDKRLKILRKFIATIKYSMIKNRFGR